MKSKNVILASLLLLSVATFGQKDQIKAAEKAFKKGNIDEVNTALKEAEPLIANASDAEKAHFYYLKGVVLLDLADKKIDADKNFSLAAKANQEVIAIEKSSGKMEFSSLAQGANAKIKNKLINAAIADSKEQKFNEGADKLYEVYLLDKKDTLNLYYAASFELNAKDYDTALKYFEELKTLKFTGKSKNYLAKSKLTDKEESFATIAERDRMIKLKTHADPRVEIVPSKQGEIYKNMALIYIFQKKNEEAKKVITEARAMNPDDTSLIVSEANLYLESNDFVTYKKLISEALEKNPNDTDLLFNLGVINSKSKNIVDAEKYYKRVIEVNPKYMNAYINLAALKLEAETPINTEMNKLGTSDKDNKRYEVLKAEKKKIYESVIPFLKTANEIDPSNSDVSNTLLKVYSALERTAEYKELKARM